MKVYDNAVVRACRPSCRGQHGPHARHGYLAVERWEQRRRRFMNRIKRAVRIGVHIARVARDDPDRERGRKHTGTITEKSCRICGLTVQLSDAQLRRAGWARAHTPDQTTYTCPQHRGQKRLA